MNTKEKILVTALRLFAVYGYEAVSVSQIAGELGITKGALYNQKIKEPFYCNHLAAVSKLRQPQCVSS